MCSVSALTLQACHRATITMHTFTCGFLVPSFLMYSLYTVKYDKVQGSVPVAWHLSTFAFTKKLDIFHKTMTMAEFP